LTPAQIVMRTACCVTLLLLVSMSRVGFAQEKTDTTGDSLDRDVTVVGRDETALPVPALGAAEEIVVPDVAPELPITSLVPPIQPPLEAGAPDAADQAADDESAQQPP
jgi:hypothetical protein